MSPLVAGVLGSLLAGLGTGVGALLVFVRPSWSAEARRLMLATAGGMMLGATFLSLLVPCIELVRERGHPASTSAVVACGGVVLGALALWGLHGITPHQHFERGREGMRRWNLGRHWLFVLAIGLHNLPEGLAVGVAYGAGAGAIGLTVALGIGVQNLPEGLAVAAALIQDGMARWRAFTIALATGLIEPVGGLVGAWAVSLSEALLPWGLSFAAGSMLFVICGEVIPETHREGREQVATFAVVLGFVAMVAIAVLLEGDPRT